MLHSSCDSIFPYLPNVMLLVSWGTQIEECERKQLTLAGRSGAVPIHVSNKLQGGKGVVLFLRFFEFRVCSFLCITYTCCCRCSGSPYPPCPHSATFVKMAAARKAPATSNKPSLVFFVSSMYFGYTSKYSHSFQNMHPAFPLPVRFFIHFIIPDTWW